jgi:hypothetical protein
MIARKPTDTVALKLRLRESLRRQVERAAKENKHSLNSELIRLIELGLEHQNWQAERLNIFAMLVPALPDNPMTAEIQRILEEGEAQDYWPSLTRVLKRRTPPG